MIDYIAYYKFKELERPTVTQIDSYFTAAFQAALKITAIANLE